MKKLLLAACLALASCGPMHVQNAGTVTAVDNAGKKGVTSANKIYTRASAAGERLVKQGLLDRDKFKAADARAFAVLLKFQAGRATLAEVAAAAAAITGAK